jgi:hypothetical protein
LQIGRRGLSWKRLDEHSFELTSLDEPFMAGLFEVVYRSQQTAVIAGEHWSVPLFDDDATTDEDRPLRPIRVTLNRSLHDARLRFLIARDGHFVHQPPPAIGEILIVPSAPPLRPFVP